MEDLRAAEVLIDYRLMSREVKVCSPLVTSCRIGRLEGRVDHAGSRTQIAWFSERAPGLLADGRPEAVVWLNVPGRGINAWW